jgi:hypothetical protein
MVDEFGEAISMLESVGLIMIMSHFHFNMQFSIFL